MKPTVKSKQVKVCHIFPIQNDLKKGDTSSVLPFNFSLEYAIKKVQKYQEGSEWNRTN
jgi:hypothetical protein